MNPLPATPEGDKTPTPLTNAAIYEEDTGHNGMVKVVSPDFARSLERRLSALEGEAIELRKDKARLDWLEATYAHAKWDDFLPGIRPRHEHEYYAIAKYVGEDGWTVRKAIDAAELACPSTTPPSQ